MVGTYTDGIYKYTHLGSFEEKNEGIPVGEINVYPKIMKFIADNVYLYTSLEMYGVFKTPLSTVNAEDITQVTAFNPVKVYPNPLNLRLANQRAAISFEQSNPKISELSIYNLKGQKIKTIHKGKTSSSKSLFYWNGKNSKNQTVSSGVYFIKPKSNTQTSVNKIMIVK